MCDCDIVMYEAIRESNLEISNGYFYLKPCRWTCNYCDDHQTEVLWAMQICKCGVPRNEMMSGIPFKKIRELSKKTEFYPCTGKCNKPRKSKFRITLT